MRITSIGKLCVCLLLVAASVPALRAQAPAPAPANDTPTQFYTRYLGVFAKATKIEQVLPFMTAARVKEVNTMPADERPKMFEFVKMLTATDVKVTKATTTATGCLIRARSSTSCSTGATSARHNASWSTI